MTISELIQQLTDIRIEHGDVRVVDANGYFLCSHDVQYDYSEDDAEPVVMVGDMIGTGG